MVFVRLAYVHDNEGTCYPLKQCGTLIVIVERDTVYQGLATHTKNILVIVWFWSFHGICCQ